MNIVKYSKPYKSLYNTPRITLKKLCNKVTEVRNTSWLNACNLAQKTFKNMQHGDKNSCLIRFQFKFHYYYFFTLGRYIPEIIKNVYIAQVRKGHKCATSAEMAVWLHNNLYITNCQDS